MKIEIAKPPMFDEILKVFPDAGKHGVIFAWGDTIYNPSGVVISPPLIAHEEVHGARQLESNGAFTRTVNTERWWEKYLINPEFRYREEIIAHAAEFHARNVMVQDRNRRAQLLMATAQRLTAPLYAYGDRRPSLRQAMSDLRGSI
jgi:hypothetical protein